MDAFRTIPMNLVAMNTEPRITTSNIYHTKERSERMAKLRGLGKIYYNMNIEALCIREHDVNMLLKLRSQDWARTINMFHEPSLAETAAQKTSKDRKELQSGGFCTDHEITVATLKRLADLTKLYKQQIVSDRAVSDEQFEIKSQYIGKVNAKEQLLETSEDLMSNQVSNCLSLMLNTVIF